MNRKLTERFLEIISFILLCLCILMILTAWNGMKQEVPILFGMKGQVLLKGSKFFTLIPLLISIAFFTISQWLKYSTYLNRKIQGRDTLERYELKAELIFGFLTIRVDILILCVLFELSMIARINLTSSMALMLLMTCIVVVLQGKYCKQHKINLLF